VPFIDWLALAAITFIAALLYSVSGFGFAVLAAPLYLLVIEPARAVQLIIILSTALSLTVVPGLWRVVSPPLLTRLALGCVAGLPLGLWLFRAADPLVVRVAIGVTILAFALLIATAQGRRNRQWGWLPMRPGCDLAAGICSGVATALSGMAGPPVLIYLLLTGAPAQTVRATLLAFFALAYGATLATHAVAIGVPGRTWLAAAILLPFAILGGFAGRPLGDRIGARAFRLLTTAILAAAGVYTLAAAAGLG
jgi:uncharacterized membrane protein YfcA